MKKIYLSGLFFAAVISSFSQCFKQPFYYPAGTNPTQLVSGLLDGDTLKDVVVMNSGANSITVFPGNASGMFPTSATYATSAYPTGAVIGDWDLDNNNDMAVCSYSGGKVDLFKNNGSGIFTFDTSYAVPTAQSLTAADIDGDLDMDIVAISYGSSSVYVMLSNGNGRFTMQSSFSSGGANPVDIEAVKIDGDDNYDLAITNYGSYTLAVFSGNDSGGFVLDSTYGTGVYPAQISYADINGDGTIDFATANAYGSAPTVSVFLNNNGVLTLSTTLDCPTFVPSDVEFFKTAGDDNYDLAVSTSNSGLIDIFKGNGDGSFTTNERFSIMLGTMYTQLYSMIHYDANGDGIEDLLSASYNNANFVVIPGNIQGWIDAQWVDYYDASANTYYDFMLAEDMNYDGKKDIITTSYSKDSLLIMNGKGDGTFDFGAIYFAGDYPNDMIINDFNGDTYLDIATLAYNTDSVILFFNNGTGSYTRTGFLTGLGVGNSYRIAEGDFDGDNDLDIIIPNRGTGASTFFLNDGMGVFSVGTTVPAQHAYYYSNDVTTGYFNADSILDFAIAIGSYHDKVAVYNSTGAFTYTVSILGGSAYDNRIDTGDLNNDGKTDLLVTYGSAGAGGVYTYLGDGMGAFTSGGATSGTVGGVQSATGDLDMDGNLDVVVPGSFINGVAFCSGNGDGTFDPYLPLWSTAADPFGVAVADSNGDGTLDIASVDVSYRDIVVVFNNFPIANLGQDLTICDGTTLTGPSGWGSYLWSTGSTARTINITNSGTYWLQFSTQCDTVIDTVSVIINVAIAPVIISDGPTSICYGDNVVLLSDSAAGYAWSTSETSQSITVTTEGNYEVTITDSNGCNASASEYITVFSLPNANGGEDDTICLSNNVTLTASGGSGFAWSTGDSTSSITITPTFTSTYFVTVTDSNNCSSIDSVIVNVDTCVGITDINSNMQVSIFPNPVSLSATVTVNGNIEGLTYSIKDLAGRTFIEKNISNNTFTIERNTLEDGLYLIELRKNDSVQSVQKLIFQ